MYLFIVALHIILCILLVLIILLQPGKGDIGAAFGGGGASTMFGPRGPTNLLQRATTVVAVLFMATSFTLAYYSNQKTLNYGGDVEEGMEGVIKERNQKRSQGAEAEEPTEAPFEETVEDPEASDP
jgi:preprotein translocase subunit SecG